MNILLDFFLCLCVGFCSSSAPGAINLEGSVAGALEDEKK